MTYKMWKRSLERSLAFQKSKSTVASQLADAIIYLSQPDLFESVDQYKQRMRALEQARANYRAICQK